MDQRTDVVAAVVAAHDRTGVFERGEQATGGAGGKPNARRQVDEPSGLSTDLGQQQQCAINALHGPHTDADITTEREAAHIIPAERE